MEKKKEKNQKKFTQITVNSTTALVIPTKVVVKYTENGMVLTHTISAFKSRSRVDTLNWLIAAVISLKSTYNSVGLTPHLILIINLFLVFDKSYTSNNMFYMYFSLYK